MHSNVNPMLITFNDFLQIPSGKLRLKVYININLPMFIFQSIDENLFQKNFNLFDI